MANKYRDEQDDRYMITNKSIPFRPKLEGEFRTRFYTVVQQINENTKTSELEKIAAQEVHWAEHECTVNLAQRKKYRAVWMLLRDLIRASWKACYREGVLEMRLPTLDKSELEGNSLSEMKSLLRSWMQDSRLERLQIYSDFINRMERETATKKSISHLIADGEELYARLLAIFEGRIEISEAITPYLQLVRENERDEYTGQKLSRNYPRKNNAVSYPRCSASESRRHGNCVLGKHCSSDNLPR